MDRICFEYQIYAISDSTKILKNAINDGALVIQLRDKSGDLDAIKEKALEIMAYKNNHAFIFILNDHPLIAVNIGADGVHIGQDISSIETRKIVGPDLIIGKTTHSIEQAFAAQSEGVDYISAGPIYDTPTKPGRKAVGLEYIKVVAENIHLPFVAIGGIDPTNIDAVLNAGAKTIGVVRSAQNTKILLAKVRQKIT